MAENSKIEWTDHTFNPWLGCTKVSDGCKHCYAETLMDKRYGRVEWGPQGTRQRTSPANWQKPLAWNRQAAAEGRRYKVFCASLADVFENRAELVPWRSDLFQLIEQTPHLDWLLLTKRPESVNDMVPGQWRNVNRWPENVWIGTSVENQATADERIPLLLDIPARVRFLSMEPLLGPVDLSGRTVDGVWIDQDYADIDPVLAEIVEEIGWGINWVIVGGESGHGSRPMNPDWVRSIRDQCVAAGVPFFFKQWGEWAPMAVEENPNFVNGLAARYPNGGRIAPGPGSHWFNGHTIAMKIGKANAGRILDGQEWSQFPQMQVTS